MTGSIFLGFMVQVSEMGDIVGEMAGSSTCSQGLL